MKPLPDLDDLSAVIQRGRMSLLATARNETEAALRDAHTALTGCPWDVLPEAVAHLRMLVDRLDAISQAHKQYTEQE